MGTYRALTPAQAKRVGSTYSDTEFEVAVARETRRRGDDGVVAFSWAHAAQLFARHLVYANKDRQPDVPHQHLASGGK